MGLFSMRQQGEGWNLDRLCMLKVYRTMFDKTVDLYNLNELCLEGVTIPENVKPRNPPI